MTFLITNTTWTQPSIWSSPIVQDSVREKFHQNDCTLHVTKTEYQQHHAKQKINKYTLSILLSKKLVLCYRKMLKSAEFI